MPASRSLATDWRPLGAVGRAHGLDGSFRVEGAVDWFSYARGERVLVAGAERRIAARRLELRPDLLAGEEE